MKTILEYLSENVHSTQLNEYLSTTKIDKTKLPKNVSMEDYFEMIFSKSFNLNKDDTEKIVDQALEIAKAYKMEKFRVFSDSDKINKIIIENECDIAVPFLSVMTGSLKYQCYDIIEDANNNYTNIEDLDLNAGVTNIAYSDYYMSVYNDNSDITIVFENVISDNIESNQKFKTYNDGRNSYIEISDRRIMLELKNMPKDEKKQDKFWNNYNMFVDDYIELAKANTGIDEIYLCGNNSKHVCVKPTLLAINKYDEIKETIKDLQDKLIKDAQDEIDYLNDED